MRLKRLVSVAAAAVLALSVSLTAFAAPSTNISGVVTVDTKDNGVDGNGNTITASLAEVPAEYQSAVADVRKPETLKALLGSAYTDTMSVVDVKDVTVADGTVFPVTIRFNVPGVTTSTKVAVLHYDTEKKAWEVVDSKAGQGTIQQHLILYHRLRLLWIRVHPLLQHLLRQENILWLYCLEQLQ